MDSHKNSQRSSGVSLHTNHSLDDGSNRRHRGFCSRLVFSFLIAFSSIGLSSSVLGAESEYPAV